MLTKIKANIKDDNKMESASFGNYDPSSEKIKKLPLIKMADPDSKITKIQDIYKGVHGY